MTRFELVRSMERFNAIAVAWKELWEKSEASAFQSHPWIGQSKLFLSRHYRLHIGTLWEGDRLIAVIPCAIRLQFGLRILEWVGQEITDYCDGLGDIAELRQCWLALLARKGYDIIRMKCVRWDASVAPLLSSSRISVTGSEKCLSLRSEWPSGDAWMAVQFPKKRNQYSRGRRKLEEAGQFKSEFHTTPPSGLVEQLRRLKFDWAIAQGVAAPLVDDHGLLAGLTDALATVGQLLLVVIKCDDDVVAASINLTHNRRVLSFFTVYNPKYDRASPGIVLLTECIRWAFDHGFVEHDHLRGTEGYKEAFSNFSNDLNDYTAVGSMVGYAALGLREVGGSVSHLIASGRQAFRPSRVQIDMVSPEKA